MTGWTVWMFASASFLALYDIAKKASVRENAVLPVLLIATACGSIAFSCALAATGRLSCAFAGATPFAIGLGLAKSLLVAISWIFTFAALRTLPITIATPIRASAPALVFVAALFVYGERPSPLQFIGICCVLAGYWAFSWAGRHEGIDFFRNRAVYLALAGMCVSAASSLFDKYVFQVASLPVESVQLVFQFGLVAVYALILAGQRILHFRHDAFTWRWTIPLVGILLAAADFLYFKGLSIPAVPISIASLLRRFSVVLTFVFGALVFREHNLRRKALALAAVLIGITLLCL